jgi:hypothetical protein
MAKVKITGHASGTGVLTVTAPNTSSDRTITLPDATGTLLNSDGDGSSLTGIASTTDVKFLAYLTADHDNQTGNGTPWYTNTAGTSWAEAYDTGNGFSNGLFTAPETGKYILCFHAYMQGITSAKNQANAYCVTSNRNYSLHHWDPATDGWVVPDAGWVMMRTLIVDMDSGDTARFNVYVYGTNSTDDIDFQGNNSCHSTSTYMSGALLA